MITYQNISTNWLRHHSGSRLYQTQRFMRWTNLAEDTPIRAISLKEVGLELILDIQIPEIHLLNFQVHVTSETICIQGSWKEAAQVKGCFCPGRFESLIALPCAVFPEATSIQEYKLGLIIHLAQQLTEESTSVVDRHWAIV